MAVTQQVARCSPSILASCQANVAALHELCSFRLLPRDHYADLDWAPSLLERLAVLAGEERLAETVDAATTTGAEVNPSYRDWPGSVWEHPVTFHPPDKVAAIAHDLDVHATFLTDADHHLADLESELPVESRASYLAEHWDTLTTFYATAAATGQCVVLWWD